MYPGQIILLSARVREGHILKAKFRLGGKREARPGHRGAAAPFPPAGAAHDSYFISASQSKRIEYAHIRTVKRTLVL